MEDKVSTENWTLRGRFAVSVKRPFNTTIHQAFDFETRLCIVQPYASDSGVGVIPFDQMDKSVIERTKKILIQLGGKDPYDNPGQKVGPLKSPLGAR